MQVPNEPGSMVRFLQTLGKRLLSFSLPLFIGSGVYQYSFGILPHRRPITVVIGAPIKTPTPMKIAAQSDDNDIPTELIDEYHKKYVDSLIALFDEHNPKYGHPDSKLTII